jgi:hypothetical protein
MNLFLNRNISNFNCRIFPKTEAREDEDIIEAGISAVDVFIRDNYRRFCEGIPIQVVLDMRSNGSYPELYKLKQRNFELQVKEKCLRVRRAINKKITYWYQLREDCKQRLKPKQQQMEQLIEDMS